MCYPSASLQIYLPFHNFVPQSTVSRRTLRITATLLFRLSHCSFVQLITFDPILLHLLPLRSWLPLVHSHQPWLCVSRKTREDVIFGRDWFNYCAAEPFVSMDLIEPGMCLCFGALSQSCIRARASLGEILVIPFLCLTNKLSLGDTTVVEQCLSATQDDFSMLDSDVPPGAGATTSSLNSNMGSCSSTIIASGEFDERFTDFF